MQKKVIGKLANKAEISIRAIRRWKKNEFKFLEIQDPLTTITLPPGRLENKLSFSLEKVI